MFKDIIKKDIKTILLYIPLGVTTSFLSMINVRIFQNILDNITELDN